MLQFDGAIEFPYVLPSFFVVAAAALFFSSDIYYVLQFKVTYKLRIMYWFLAGNIADVSECDMWFYCNLRSNNIFLCRPFHRNRDLCVAEVDKPH